jgi:sigma-B regulation protein RsbU (phosphoserine phosphatase)
MPHRTDAEILVVDDDPLSRQLLMRIVRGAGLECAEVGSGAEAWKRIREKPPAILLLDFDMPEMSGTDLLKRLRAESDAAIAKIPAIMLTGHVDERSEIACLEAGADDFVTKPVNVAVLRARIDTQLRLGYMRRQLEAQNAELESWRINLERDLEAARLTQQALIPQKPLQLPGWEIASLFRPVIQVGGDIYGWLPMKEGQILFWIADATGHGASAALLTTLTKLLFHHGSSDEAAPRVIMEAVNNDFRSIFGAHLFMTAMCVALEPATGRATVLGAGHPPLLICRKNGDRECIRSAAPPLGLADRSQFVETIVDLAAGDAFVLYTDGLFGSGKGKPWGFTPEQLGQTMNPEASTMEAMLMRMVKEAIPAHGNGTAADDIAAVGVRRNA